jgi:triphosphoribosyl-dephospho-CoA synthetase
MRWVAASGLAGGAKCVEDGQRLELDRDGVKRNYGAGAAADLIGVAATMVHYPHRARNLSTRRRDLGQRMVDLRAGVP